MLQLRRALQTKHAHEGGEEIHLLFALLAQVWGTRDEIYLKTEYGTGAAQNESAGT